MPTLGYQDEGVACWVPAAAGPGTAPFYRSYQPQYSDHFYTTSAVERDSAEQNLGPTVSLTTMTTAMQSAYNQASIKVVVATKQYISAPPEVDVDVGSCSGGPTSEQSDLYRNRDFVGPNEITVYFVRTTVPAYNGCATHPSDRPGAVVAQGASQWTMAHEVGHVLGLPHLSGENCSAPGYVPSRLMTGCGTGLIVANPPSLVASEIQTMDQSAYTTDI